MAFDAIHSSDAEKKKDNQKACMTIAFYFGREGVDKDVLA